MKGRLRQPYAYETGYPYLDPLNFDRRFLPSGKEAW